MTRLPRFLRRRRTWQPRLEPSLDPTLFARARPESVLVEERYSCRQEYSRNSWTRQLPERTGRISVRMPYDGHQWFTRDALEDVEKRIPAGSGSEHEATIGHLLFVDHEETNLSEVLTLAGRFGAFPIRVPVRNTSLGTPKDLTSDRCEHKFDATYLPSETRPKIIPLQLSVRLSDPDHSDSLFTTRDQRLKTSEADDSRDRVADAIKKFAGFQPYLTLEVHALLTLPPRAGWDGATPLVRTTRVTLPESAALPASSVTLRQGGDGPLQIDSRIGSLDWRGLPMHRYGPTGEEAPRRFISPAMTLRFDQPGELFDEHEIEIEVEVEVPEELLSGTQVRLFDARGDLVRPGDDSPLTVRSVVSTTCTVVLRDAFAERDAIPFQSFAFDEIVPDELRIVDVHASLVDQLFTVQEFSPEQNDKKQIRRLLIAERTDGPNRMTLWVLIEGRRHATRRESRQPWGHRYTSKFESGALHIYVRGRVRGDTRNVVEEISQLQLSLRDRFRRLKAYR